MNLENTKVFNVILAGHENVGKTSFVQAHLTGEFHEYYLPTIGVDVHPFVLNTNVGKFCFNFGILQEKMKIKEIFLFIIIIKIVQSLCMITKIKNHMKK